MQEFTKKIYQKIYILSVQAVDEIKESSGNLSVMPNPEKELVDKVDSWIKNFKNQVLNHIDSATDDNYLETKGFVQKGFFKDVFSGVINFFKGIGEKIGKMVQNVANWVKTVVKKTVMWFQGVEKYEIVFSGEDNACETCREMAGEIFSRDELKIGETAPPFHPNCRCKIIPHVASEAVAETENEEGQPASGQGKSGPTKAQVYCSNKYLTMEEMKVNARYIYNYLTAQGWTKNAISALLGNMQAESTINPGRWQNGYKVGDPEAGFGIVQWTPATKFIDWAKENDLDYKDIDAQLQRVLAEVKATNGAHECFQWMKSKHSENMSFEEFTQSTQSPKKLAEIFLLCYERPKVKNQKESGKRAENAINWSNFLNPQNQSKYFQNYQYMI